MGLPLRERSAIALSLSAAACALFGCPSSESRPTETCTGAQALSAPSALLFGQSLGDKQLALTFDDGPASRTAELSTWLKGEGVRAAFFVNGDKVANPAVLSQIVADGHVVGNHTQTHANLVTAYAGNAAAIVKELADTDAVIAPFVPHGRFMFRAPFGAYDTFVYDSLQASAMKKYVGHIEWDVGGQYDPESGRAADWACWQQGSRTSKACGDLYISEITTRTKGIVLLHDADYGDPANTDVNSGKGNTIDMVKYVVPRLKQAGYTFVRVDEVPDIAALLPALPADAGPDATTGGSSGTSGTTSPRPDADGGDPCPP